MRKRLDGDQSPLVAPKSIRYRDGVIARSWRMASPTPFALHTGRLDAINKWVGGTLAGGLAGALSGGPECGP